jgi:hypothetical protein
MDKPTILETDPRVLDVLKDVGAEQLEPIQPTPVGCKTRFRRVDGLIVEYATNHAPSGGS